MTGVQTCALPIYKSVVCNEIDHPTKNSNKKEITLTNPHNYQPVLLQIPLSYSSLELIDGQHRLFGFIGTQEATKKNYNLVVLGIANISNRKKTETFVAINDNSRRMDANLVSYLKYTTNEHDCQANTELMAIRIVVDLNQVSPFKQRIKLLDMHSDEKVTLRGFSGYDLKGLIAPKGLLRKRLGKNQSNEFVKALALYFSVIKNEFSREWNDPGKYIIATNRGISAFLKLLKSILKNDNAKFDRNLISKYIKILKKYSRSKDWETEELKNSYIGSKGWKDFHKDLVKMIKKDISTFKE